MVFIFFYEPYLISYVIVFFINIFKLKVQKILVEYFVFEVASKATADLIEIQSNSTALFINKIIQVIMLNCNQDALRYSVGFSNLMKAILVVIAKEKQSRVSK